MEDDDRAAHHSEVVILEAEALYRAGDYGASALTLTPLVEASRPDARALCITGLCRLHQDESSEALRLLDQAHQLAPGDPTIQLHFAIGLQANGRHREAVPHFKACQRTLASDPAPFLNFASSALVLGELGEARRAARRARVRAPQLPQVHYVLGQIELAQAQHAAAEAAFVRATQLAPNFVDAWVNLGVARYRNGALEGAKSAMRKALSIAPHHGAATANLAAFLRLSGGWQEAEAMLRALLDRDPNAGAARLNLAAYLLHDDRAEDALALLDRPTPLDPALGQHWRLQKSIAYLRLGRVSEARATLSDVDTADPATAALLCWRRLLLADAQSDAAEAERAAGDMETSLQSNGNAMLPEHRIMGHYDLARFWSGRRDAERAFTQWTLGHRLLARFQPFSRAAYKSFVDATIAEFDKTRLTHGARAANRDETPVFVVGMPRSGTTLTEQILAAHPDVFGAGERASLEAAFYKLGGAAETPRAAARIAALDASALEREAQLYLRELHALAPGARRIIDKMPNNFRILGLARLMFPKARIIWCLRDPRDIGLSIYSLRFFGHHPYAHDLDDLGWYFGQHQILLRHWQAVMPDAICTVRLNEWVDNFPVTLNKITNFLGLEYDRACERFYLDDRQVHTASRRQVRQPVNANGIGRWRHFEQQLAPLLESLEVNGAYEASL